METNLPAYSEVGGYTITYTDEEGNVLCAECANLARKIGGEVTSFIHWEGECLNCDDCEDTIQPEYGDTEEAV